jgi:hypothetical protein
MTEEINHKTSDAIDTIVVERLKADLKLMLSMNVNLERPEDVTSVVGVLKYYMLKEDYETFFREIGYKVDTPKENIIHFVDVKDNPDGSADVTVSFSGDKMKKSLIEEGLSYVLLKGALNLSNDDIVRLVQRGMQEEKTDKILDSF